MRVFYALAIKDLGGEGGNKLLLSYLPFCNDTAKTGAAGLPLLVDISLVLPDALSEEIEPILVNLNFWPVWFVRPSNMKISQRHFIMYLSRL